VEVALQEIRVIDLSTRLSGAWAARLFGNFGAEVILVEDQDGHPLRLEPPFSEEGVSLLHAYANSEKITVSRTELDFDELIRSADVVITNEVNFDERLNDLTPDQVHLSITPHGLSGPLANEPGNNLTACARVGWSAINAFEGDPPLQLPHNQTGFIAGIAGFVGASAMLYRVQCSGKGDLVDVSEIEALSNTCAPWAQVGNFIGGNRMAHGPNGRRTRDRPGPLWKTKNGAINFGYGDWKQWTEAFAFLEKPEIGEDPNFISAWGRHQKDTRPVRDGLADAVAERDKWEVFHGLANFRCISGVVQNAKELVENEHLNAREFILDTEVGSRAAKTAGAFAKFSESPLRYSRPAPQSTANPSELPKHERPTRPLEETDELPLKGIRVLTFTQAWSGTFGTQLLALLGAEVIQIESRKRPDVWRGAGAPVPPALRNPDIEQNPLNTNGMYNTVNLNKKAVTLDVTTPEGKKLFWDMIPNFDILADNFSPHVMTNWGVTLETLRKRNPDIIFASLSGYGRTGPLAQYPANGATTEPMAGLSSLHGYEDDTAQNTGGLIPDPISGFYFAASIIAALHYRRSTGKGQRIDLSMIESVAVNVGDAILEYSTNGHIRSPLGNRHPRIAPHNVYQTADEQWLALATESEESFRALASTAKLDFIRFATMENRKQKEDELDIYIGNWVSRYNLNELLERLSGTGITHSAVREFQPIYKRPDAHYSKRQFLIEVDHPECGKHYAPANPWIYRNTPRGPIRYAPCFGEHSEEVFQAELGVSREEYLTLEKNGITGKTRL